MCQNEDNIIEKADFACIGDVATHCIVDKLCIAIGFAQEFDLSELFCDFWQDILTIIAEVDEYDEAYAEYLVELAECDLDPECTTPPVEPVEPENYLLKKNLVCGGTFETCNGKTRSHQGVKRIAVFYSYARYILINSTSDTAAGKKTLNNEFSIPVPRKELKEESDMYRTMGYESYKKTKAFLCASRETFTEFDSCGCGTCSCGGGCESKTKAKGYGFNSSNIKKNIGHTHYPNVLSERRNGNDM